MVPLSALSERSLCSQRLIHILERTHDCVMSNPTYNGAVERRVTGVLSLALRTFNDILTSLILS